MPIAPQVELAEPTRPRLPFGLTPGLVDDAARYAFTAGGCGALAVALHDRTRWPIWAVCDALLTRSCRYPHAATGAPHFAVRHPSGLLLDIGGLHPDSRLIRLYSAVVGYPLATALCDPDDVRSWKWLDVLVPPDLTATYVDPLLALHP